MEYILARHIYYRCGTESGTSNTLKFFNIYTYIQMQNAVARSSMKTAVDYEYI